MPDERESRYTLIGITSTRRKYLVIATGDKRNGVWGEDTSLWPRWGEIPPDSTDFSH